MSTQQDSAISQIRQEKPCYGIVETKSVPNFQRITFFDIFGATSVLAARFLPPYRWYSVAQMSEVPPDPDQENARDVELMLQVQATSDHEVFRELIERHQNAVVGTVAKMLGNPSEAEDIAQQVFLRLWKSRARYQPKR